VAVLMRMEFPGGTTEQYDEINRILTVDDDTPPEGLILHMCGKTDDGIVIMDVWDSAEDAAAFFESGLGDALEQAEAPQAETQMHKVHNMIPKGGGEAANVIVEIEVDAGTDVYDDMLGQMPSHLGDDSDHPVHAHIAAVTDDGKMYIVDLWESPEAFGAFAESEVAPAAGDRLDEIQPKFTPVHNVIRGTADAPAS
jgi:heme-degrading monooxygenase HmoA